MPLGRPSEPDRYLRRIAVAGGLGLLLLLLIPLLGPSPERIHEILLGHVGVEGPTLILDKIEVLPEDDLRTIDPKEALPGATEGLSLPPELSKPVEDSDLLTERKDPDPGKTAPEHWTRRILPDVGQDAERSQPERRAATQRTLDFVLERFVEPAYPDDAGDRARQRVVLVKVGMWVNAQGQVEHAYIIESDGGELFNDAVLAAVRQWRYRPVVRERAPEGFWDQQLFRFVVTKEGVKAEMIEG